MRAPTITYRYIYPKDVAGPTFEILSRAISTSVTSATPSLDIQGIPKDKVLVLTNVVVQANPGATQSVEEISVNAFTAAGLGFAPRIETPVPVADQNRVLNWEGEVYLPGRGADGTSLTLAATFNAGVAANLIIAHVHGIVIPRGNSSAF